METKFVAYWNGNIDNPILQRQVPENNKMKLCVVTIEELPKPRQVYSKNAINKSASKLNRELKNLSKVSRKLNG